MKDKIIRDLVKALEAFIEEFESQEELCERDGLTSTAKVAIAQAKRCLDPLEGLPLASVPVIPASESITATAQAMAERRRFSFEDLPLGTVVITNRLSGEYMVIGHRPIAGVVRLEQQGTPLAEIARQHLLPLESITGIISTSRQINPIIENPMANRDPDDIPF